MPCKLFRIGLTENYHGNAFVNGCIMVHPNTLGEHLDLGNCPSDFCLLHHRGAAFRWVHLFRFGRSIEIMRVNCKVVVSLAPSPRYPDSEVVGSVFDMPAGAK